MSLDVRPPHERVLMLSNAHLVARSLHVVADIGVADALDDEPLPADVLASRTGVNADALNRMLRLLTGHGVFAQADGGYAHTAASRLLRADHPQSVRAAVRMIGLPLFWDDVTELHHVVTTGRPFVDYAGVVDYMAAHPAESQLFDEAMAGKSAMQVGVVTGTYDFSPFATIADIGGGAGHLVRAILRKVPHASGVLFDRPHVVGAAPPADRLRLVGGDFFRDPLPEADAYVLMDVLHDWVDDDVVRILGAVRRAAPRDARVLIVEALVPATTGPAYATLADVLMLAITGGRERTAAEHAALLASSGLRLDRVVATPTPHSIVEASVA